MSVIFCIYLSGGEVRWIAHLFAVFVVVAAIAGGSWQFFFQWLDGVRGRKWPTVAAVVDLVSVQKRESSGRGGFTYVSYIAKLTYMYRSPEWQKGNYEKSFQSEDEAQAWANSYKGSTVKVHVDPRDPAHSVLRKEDL